LGKINRDQDYRVKGIAGWIRDYKIKGLAGWIRDQDYKIKRLEDKEDRQ
jgi:hypothetical protein